LERILLSARAVRDLRRLEPGPELDRIEAGLQRLSSGEPYLDIRPLSGRAPWLRLRVGDWRLLFRPAGAELLVARIGHRSELQQAIRTLEEASRLPDLAWVTPDPTLGCGARLLPEGHSPEAGKVSGADGLPQRVSEPPRATKTATLNRAALIVSDQAVRK